MAGRPYWSGQIRISLVSFRVALKSVLKRSSQIPLHEIDRKSGSRIHHMNVSEDGKEVERDDIVKGYELENNNYVLLEDDEIDAIKLPSSDTLELVTFCDLSSVPLMRFERPYYIVPDSKDADEIYAIMHEALLSSGKMGIGQITMRGREELCGVYANEKGLMLATLRYNAELAIDDDPLPELGKKKLKSDYVNLAEQLIKKNTHAPNFDKFHDHYHEALLELIKAKKAHRKPHFAKAKPQGKVIDFADALRKSLGTKSDKSARPSTRAKRRKRA